MLIDLVRVIEELVWSYPGAKYIKNGASHIELMPGQEKIESDVTTSQFAIPLNCGNGNGQSFVKIHFTYDKRVHSGFIRMSDAHMGMVIGRDIGVHEGDGYPIPQYVAGRHVIKPLYNIINEGQNKARVDMTCFKCKHVVEHECF